MSHLLFVGASSGIGQATAVHFASLGAKLTITGRNPSTLEATKKQCEAAGM